jgi:hypothetical protein
LRRKGVARVSRQHWHLFKRAVASSIPLLSADSVTRNPDSKLLCPTPYLQINKDFTVNKIIHIFYYCMMCFCPFFWSLCCFRVGISKVRKNCLSGAGQVPDIPNKWSSTVYTTVGKFSFSRWNTNIGFFYHVWLNLTWYCVLLILSSLSSLRVRKWNVFAAKLSIPSSVKCKGKVLVRITMWKNGVMINYRVVGVLHTLVWAWFWVMFML